MTNKPQSENKTIEQIRDELAHKYFNDDDMRFMPRLECQFKSGFDAAIALSEKRAAGLVEALEHANEILTFIGNKDAFVGFRIAYRDMANDGARNSSEALYKYRSEG